MAAREAFTDNWQKKEWRKCRPAAEWGGELLIRDVEITETFNVFFTLFFTSQTCFQQL